MAYKIIYMPKPKKSKLPAMVCAGIFLFSAYTYRNEIKHQLLPAKEAVNTLINDLEQGESFREAVETFCQEIFYANKN